MAEGPDQLADEVLEGAIDEVHLHARQRHAARVPWRVPTMHGTIRLALAAVAVAVIAVGAMLLSPRTPQRGIGSEPTTSQAAEKGSSPSPTTTSKRTQLVSPEAFAIPLSVSLPSEWRIVTDERDRFTAGRRIGGPGWWPISAGIDLVIVPEVYPDPCDTTVGWSAGETPVGPTARDLADWLISMDLLNATAAPEPVQVAGLPAIVLDEAYKPIRTDQYAQGMEGPCPDAALWPIAAGRYEIHGDERLEFYVMDVDDQRVVAIVMGLEANFDRVADEVRAVLETLEFR
jgi:hypothetical protein